MNTTGQDPVRFQGPPHGTGSKGIARTSVYVLSSTLASLEFSTNEICLTVSWSNFN